jgi:hypothetical protein
MTAADLADQFLVCIEGSIVLARIYDDPAYLRRGLANNFDAALTRPKVAERKAQHRNVR